MSPDSTQALLRLNSYRFSYYLSHERSQFFNDLLQQIKKSISLMNDQLQVTYNTQSDPSDFSKLLVEFSIHKASDPLNDPSTNDIINDLDTIIKNKYISSLSDKPFMMFLDNQYGFQAK
ncbi:4142_t:CDS:1, partial [Racocetra fulgida]